MRTTLVDMAPVAEVPQARLRTFDPTTVFLGLFDRLTLRQRLSRVRHGLRQPPDTGEHRWAVIERQRLIGAAVAWTVPLLLALLLTLVTARPERFSDHGWVSPRPPPPVAPLDPVYTPEEPSLTELPLLQETAGFSDLVADLSVNDPSPEPEPAQVPNLGAVAPTRSLVSFPLPPGRTDKGREKALTDNAAGYTAPAVLKALRWLKTQQESDGAWPKTRPAMTALATLAYLAYGVTTESAEFGRTLELALRYLVEAQEDGGRFRGRDTHDYTQPVVAYALAEAYGMLHMPQLEAPAERAIQVVIDGQNAVGGFNYNLQGAADTRNDMTYTSWCVQALKAASIAHLGNAGLDACMRKALAGVRRNYGEAGGYGGYGYTGPGGGGTALSGAGVLCLQFLGDMSSREYRGGIAGLDRAVFAWSEIPAGWSRSPLYYGYYITQARFQHGGDSWRGWKDAFAPVLVRRQTTVAAADSGYTDAGGEARDIGYWDSPSPTELTGGNGRIMDTILCTLMLEVYYRYLPTFRTPAPPAAADGRAAPDTPLMTVDVRFGRKAGGGDALGAR